MPLIRHIAGVPSVTEQRCVRCCEVLIRANAPSKAGVIMHGAPWWPGELFCVGSGEELSDCKPVNLSESQPHVEIHVSGEALIVDHKRVADAVRKAAEEYRSSFGTELL